MREAGRGKREFGIGVSGERRRSASIEAEKLNGFHTSRFPSPFPLSHTHQITSAGLGAVECAVRAIQEILSSLDFRLGEIGDANAHREP